ncbi:alpha/beta hydrolase [Nocardiopsis ganjiahuensis]|uniref:alpha/beta hydrolase n=1 Tax=Nocardiopsis ganjiahuensis TaxID=239984 RepID=UPI00034B1A76|nr:alpha/beta hydrolase [Nocardiopsis ganjiahuensis]
MRYRSTRALAAGALVTALATGCSLIPAIQETQENITGQVESAGALQRLRTQNLNWGPCYSSSDVDEILEFWDVDEDWQRNLECGVMVAPLDYRDPEQYRLRIALIRQPATGTDEQRRGSLVLNPGGPGGTGQDMLFDEILSPEIREAYDLVSFDPRGVGASNPVACHEAEDGVWAEEGTDRWEDLLAWDLEPDDLSDTDLQELDEAAREYAEVCAEEEGEDFLAHLGSLDVAHDMDLLREALGEDELNYVGYSYGTHLGAVYADAYPDRVGAMVLDGGVDLAISPADTLVEQLAGFQATWELFVEDCAATRNNCAFSGPDRATGEMQQILGDLDEDPLVMHDPVWAEEKVVVDGDIMLDITMQALYSEDMWPDLSDALADLDAGDHQRAAYFVSYLYMVAYGHPDEEFDEADLVNAETARTAVECADHPVDATAVDTSDHRDLMERAHDASALFGGLAVWPLMVCSHWVEAEAAPTGFTAPDAPPIVVIGTVGDPATPYGWSQSLAERLASATLVTYEGSGHGVYGFGLNDCVDEVIDTYILEGVTPGSGHFCAPTG